MIPLLLARKFGDGELSTKVFIYLFSGPSHWGCWIIQVYGCQWFWGIQCQHNIELPRYWNKPNLIASQMYCVQDIPRWSKWITISLHAVFSFWKASNLSVKDKMFLSCIILFIIKLRILLQIFRIVYGILISLCPQNKWMWIKRVICIIYLNYQYCD